MIARHFATRPDIVISRNGQPLLVIGTNWMRLKGAVDDRKRGIGQGDVYQMMAYAHISDCKRVILLNPHHHELGEEEGMLQFIKIANKVDRLIGIAT